MLAPCLGAGRLRFEALALLLGRAPGLGEGALLGQLLLLAGGLPALGFEALALLLGQAPGLGEGALLQLALPDGHLLSHLAPMPVLFGLQQFFEVLVWIAGSHGSGQAVERYSLAYMFFSWLAWPVWIPLMTYFMEPCRRRYLYLLFAIAGAMIGAMQVLSVLRS